MGESEHRMVFELLEIPLVDMHCHLGFSFDPGLLASELQLQKVGCFSSTVTPAAYKKAVQTLSSYPNTQTGVGLHPWWVGKPLGSLDVVELCASFISQTRFVGEVGLDFSAKHSDTCEEQIRVFDYLMSVAAAVGDKVISVHAARAVPEVLEIAEVHGVSKANAFIFHWFSGSAEDLQKAIKMGCYFSVGERMLATKKGRAYASALPLERLLLETDLPSKEGVACSAATLRASLEKTVYQLAELRGISAGELACVTTKTGSDLLQISL